MPLVANLMAFGCSGFEAIAIVGDVANNLTALGSTQGTALKLSAVNSIVTTAAASTGVQVPPMGPGDTIQVANLGANALLVYPITGGTVQGGAANAGYSVPTLKTLQLTARDGVGNLIAVLSA